MMFAHAPVLALLLLVPFMIVFFIWRWRVRLSKLSRIGDLLLLAEMAATVSQRRRQWKAGLWTAALVALIIALARPLWGVDAEVIESQGVAVMVVLDASASMDAEDMLPSRLERAKLDLSDLFRALEGNELGLILFAGDAFVQFPLTSDVNSALVFLSAVSSASMTRQGSSIEVALILAMESFDERIAAQSVIVLVSDGENQEGDALAAAEQAAQRGITIHTIGYGDVQPVPIPYTNAEGLREYKSDRGGNIALTSLQEDLLVAIAGVTGGIYQRASLDGAAMTGLAGQINALEGRLLESTLANRPVERFGLFVAVALLMLTLEILLPETKPEGRLG